MAIARKNKDLADIFLAIVQKGKPVYLKDKDLIDNTIKTIKNLNCKTISDLNLKLDELKKQFQREMKNPENALTGSAINNGKSDIYSMIQSILEYYVNKNKDASSVETFIDFIAEVFVTEPSDDAVIVSSIHQVKGLEAKRVFVINYNLMPYTSNRKTADDNIQEKNLRYIAVTRAKEVLYLCEGEEDEAEKEYRGSQKEIDELIKKALNMEDSDDDYSYDYDLDYDEDEDGFEF